MPDPAPRVVYADALPIGTEIYGYTIRGVLGRGGFGTTYHATDRLDQSFAIKEYFPRQFAMRQGLEIVATSALEQENLDLCRARFLQEAKTLSQLGRTVNDDSIVKVSTYFEAHGTAYIVMEFLSGGSFEGVLRRSPGGIPGEQLQTFLRAVLLALDRVHGVGLMHRDIKPANIIIQASGRPVLIDFGSARETSPNQNTTYTRIFSGSYAPIEQISGLRQGPFSDIYALGAVCYRAIGGTLVDSLTRHQAVMARKPDPLPSAFQVGAGRYSAELLHAIDCALAINAEDRPQTAGELLAMLDAAPSPDDVTAVDVTIPRPKEMPEGGDGRPVRMLTAVRPEADGAGSRAAARRPFGWRNAAVAAAGLLIIAALTVVLAPIISDLRRDANAWTAVLARPDEAAYRGYLQRFPAGWHRAEAARGLQALTEWTALRKSATSDQLAELIARYPDQPFAAEARKRQALLREQEAPERERKAADAWNRVKASDRPDELQGYLDKYPDSAFAADAKARLADIKRRAEESSAWEAVKDSASSDDIHAFLTRFPNGANAAAARQKLAKLQDEDDRRKRAQQAADAWNRVKASDRPDELQGYLDQYPDSAFAADAKARLADIKRRAEESSAWEAVKDSASSDDIHAFLTRFPNGANAAAAQQKLAKLQDEDDRRKRAQQAADAWNCVKASDRPDELQGYLDKYPDSAFVADAKARLADVKRRAEETALTTEQAAEAQRLLALLGYGTGTADGKVGPKTSAAVSAFEKKQGMAVDGKITLVLLEMLIKEAEARGKQAEAVVTPMQSPPAPSDRGAADSPAALAAAPPAAAIEEIEGAYITVKRANIREKPLADAKLIKALEPGVPLTVTGRVKDTGWFRVASLDNKVRGFLPGDAIQDVRAAEEAEWQQVKDAKKSAVLVDFLRRYPAGTYAGQAKVLRDDLVKDEEAARRQQAEEVERKKAEEAALKAQQEVARKAEQEAELKAQPELAKPQQQAMIAPSASKSGLGQAASHFDGKWRGTASGGRHTNSSSVQASEGSCSFWDITATVVDGKLVGTAKSYLSLTLVGDVAADGSITGNTNFGGTLTGAFSGTTFHGKLDLPSCGNIIVAMEREISASTTAVPANASKPEPASTTPAQSAALPRPAVVAGETRATKEEITTAFVGKTVKIGSAELTYTTDGSYTYVNAGGKKSNGKYIIQDATICVNFTDGHSRCDTILKTGVATAPMIGDVGAIPFIGENCRALYGQFLHADRPRGFAIAPDGACGLGRGSSALSTCEKYTKDKGKCFFYAFNDEVKWKPDAVANPFVLVNKSGERYPLEFK